MFVFAESVKAEEFNQVQILEGIGVPLLSASLPQNFLVWYQTTIALQKTINGKLMPRNAHTGGKRFPLTCENFSDKSPFKQNWSLNQIHFYCFVAVHHKTINSTQQLRTRIDELWLFKFFFYFLVERNSIQSHGHISLFTSHLWLCFWRLCVMFIINNQSILPWKCWKP